MAGISRCRRWFFSRQTARIGAAGLLIASVTLGAATMASAAPPANGNNGTVQIGTGNGNDPHLTCPIAIKWSGFDAGVTKDYDVAFGGISPTGGSPAAVAPSDPTSGSFTTTAQTLNYWLQITGGTPKKNGEYHVNITVTTQLAANTDTKSKTVWLKNCVGSGTVSVAGACNTNKDGYDWTVTATPAVGSPPVTGSWTSTTTNGTYATDAAGDGTFSTTGVGENTVTLTVNEAGWTVSPSGTPTATAVACASGNTPSDLSLSAACSPTTAGQVDWTITNPAGNPTVDVVGVSPTGAVTTSVAPTTLAAGASATFTTDAPLSTGNLTASGTTNPGGVTLTSNTLGFAGTCTTGSAETPATVTFSDTCTVVHVVFTSAGPAHDPVRRHRAGRQHRHRRRQRHRRLPGRRHGQAHSGEVRRPERQPHVDGAGRLRQRQPGRRGPEGLVQQGLQDRDHRRAEQHGRHRRRGVHGHGRQRQEPRRRGPRRADRAEELLRDGGQHR